MKKVYSLVIAGLAAGCAFGQTVKLTFRVDMKNETVSSNGVHVPGNYQVDAGMSSNWSPGDAGAKLTDGDADNIYELQVTVKANTTYEFKFVNNNDWNSGIENTSGSCFTNGNRVVTVGSSDTTLAAVCFGSCDPCPSSIFKRNVKFMIVDSNYTNNNFKFTDVKLKGAFSGWSDFTAYDDGTNGDATSGDGIWTAIYEVKEGTWEWGGTNTGNWFIQGPNRSLTMSNNGTVTGDTVYRIAQVGALINVTFRVDMTDTITNSEGVYVTGNFLSYLENKINDWNKDTLKMNRIGTTGEYTLTVRLYAGDYVYKFYNGKGNADDSRGENWNFASTGCGIANGLGGYNRSLSLKGRTTDITMPFYKWNRCELSTLSTKEVISTGALTLYPNPSQGAFTLNLTESFIASVKVTDLSGRTLSSIAGLNQSAYQVEGLNAGVYLVTVTDAQGRTATLRTVVQ